MAGPRATALRVTWLYISPIPARKRSPSVEIGREMVVSEKSGPWLSVYANTDIEEVSEKDQPMIPALAIRHRPFQAGFRPRESLKRQHRTEIRF